MPKEFPALLGDLLRYAKHAIKIANKISNETNKQSSDSLVYGPGQGSAASATGWGILVLKTLDTQDKNQYGSHYLDSQGGNETVI